MKKLITTLTLLLMFSSPSFAEWTAVVKGVESGDTFYVDFDRIRKVDGFVYYWELIDYLKPQYGDFSYRGYQQGDCKLFRKRELSYSFYTQPFAEGTPSPSTNKPSEWLYPPPNSANESTLNAVCNR